MESFVLNGEYTVYDLMAMVREQVGEYFKRDWVAKNASAVKAYLKTAIGLEQRERFCVMFLDNKHQLIAFETLFSGTVDASAVYPREIVKRALELNACAVIFAHNHPSGKPEPSQSDITITRKLKDALALIEVRVLDHIVVGEECTSMAERGLF